jgi:cytochrome c
MGSSMTRWAAFLVAGIALLPGAPSLAANVAAGRQVFARCKICHTLAPGAPSTVGPNLHGLFGRRAGTYDHYAYSPAMQRSGIVWDDSTLDAFLRDPMARIPGTTMGFPGIPDSGARANLLTYLKQATE